MTVGIDPGSQNIRLIKDGKIVFDETNQIFFSRPTGEKILGIGDCKLTEEAIKIKPVNCVIYDFHAFELLVRQAVKSIGGSRSFLPKSLKSYWNIPTHASEVDKRAYRDSGEHCNAVEVYLIFQAYSAAVGMDILFEKKDFILIDFGASKIDITIFINSKIEAVGYIPMGTWKIFSLIKNHLHRVCNIDASDEEILNLFKELDEDNERIEIQYTQINSNEIRSILDGFFYLVNDEYRETIEHLIKNPDIRKVILNGVYFTGGGSMIDFLRKQIKLDEEIKVFVSRAPLLDTANGLAKIIEAVK